MRNPRPCFWCSRPENEHRLIRYVPAKRTEPLRAERQPLAPFVARRDRIHADLADVTRALEELDALLDDYLAKR